MKEALKRRILLYTGLAGLVMFVTLIVFIMVSDMLKQQAREREEAQRSEAIAKQAKREQELLRYAESLVEEVQSESVVEKWELGLGGARVPGHPRRLRMHPSADEMEQIIGKADESMGGLKWKVTYHYPYGTTEREDKPKIRTVIHASFDDKGKLETLWVHNHDRLEKISQDTDDWSKRKWRLFDLDSP